MTVAQVDQVTVEVLRSSTGVNAQIDQVTGEVLRLKLPAALVDQVTAEVLRKESVTYTDLNINVDDIRCILVETTARVSGVETTRYLSSRPYVDTENSRIYLPYLRSSSVKLVERLDIEGNSSISYGDIEFDNTSGELDSWFSDIWANRSITVLIGDVRNVRSTYQTIFSGVIEDVGSRNRDALNLKLRNKFERLNAPVSETKLGGSTSNKAELLPLCLGECFNVTPLLTNPATLEYQVHNGGIEQIIEVRDNGVPVSKTATVSTGKFTLAATPAGKITASVQGERSPDYKNTVRGIVQRLVTYYGGYPSQRFSGADLDFDNLDQFDIDNPQPIGVFVDGRENVMSLCSSVARSVGAQMVMNREGRMQLIKVDVPAGGPYDAIGVGDIIKGSLYISEKLPVSASFKVGYCKNWTVQTGLLTGIPRAHKDLFEQEWLSYTATDTTVKSNYKLDAEPEQIDTFLLTEADAQAEAERLLALFSVPRFIIAFDSPAPQMNLRLGDYVTITYPRFGMDSGKNGMVVGLSLDWDTFTVKVEVLI